MGRWVKVGPTPKLAVSNRRWANRALLRAFALAVTLGCGERAGQRVTESASPTPPLTPLTGAEVLVGAGDIAACSSAGDEATAALLDRIPGTVFTAGDNVYPNGTAAQFRHCYHPSWGRHRDRTYPVPGNHDYRTRNGAPYYEYFGARAGAPGRGYYSFMLGDWLVVMLNTNIAIGSGSDQLRWLRAQLAQRRNSCEIVIAHHPRFSSGPHGRSRRMSAAWVVMNQHSVELFVAGHDHIYERFAPMNAAAEVDRQRGVRQFIVGTGGFNPYAVRERQRNSEVVGSTTGVLKLLLGSGIYQWEFVPVPGQRFRDWGEGRCR